jgi:hypothetical protein
MTSGLFDNRLTRIFFGFMFLGFMAATASTALAGLPETSNLNLHQISFIPNQGQMNREVLYYHQGPKNHIFFTKSKIALLASAEEGTRAVELIPEKMRSLCRITGVEPLPGRVSYLKGEPSQWQRDLPTYAGVVYQNAWPGIDLKFYATGNQLEYDLIVAPGADPSAIRFGVNGGERLEVGPHGELIVSAAGQTVLVQKKPLAFQEIEGNRREVESRYVIDGSSFSIAVADYDQTRPLIIDPLIFSMYVGGSSSDNASSLVIDSLGYIYIAGSSISTDYPTVTLPEFGKYHFGDYDCVITRFTPDGQSIDRSIYLGGDQGDSCNAIAIRTDGEVIVAGGSSGGTFPVSATGVYDSTHNGGGDIFVARLPYDLSSLRWATYVGGNGHETALDLDLDAGNNIYVIGRSTSGGANPFPTTAGAFQSARNGLQDAVVFRLKQDGSDLDFSTYIGGSDDMGSSSPLLADSGQAIAVSTNAVYITGNAYSTDFPIAGFHLTPPSLGGSTDVFFGRLALNGTFRYLSLLGGSSADMVYDLALAPGQDYFVLTGYTWSADFPNLDGYDTSHNGQTDAFVAGVKISSFTIGDATIYQSFHQFATLLGGIDYDTGQAVAIDENGSIFMGGWTKSNDFPVKKAVDSSYSGADKSDLFLTRLSANASVLLWSTYLGGNNSDYFSDLAVDSSGAVVGLGYSYSNDFPVANYPENMGVLKGGYDAVLFKLTPKNSSTAPLGLLLN